MNSNWHVYIIRCTDNSLYTGIAKNIEKRLAQHNSGKGAKYTRGLTPVELVYSEPHPDRSSATKRELNIKAMTRSQKISLINSR